ncbi:hypothetical protein F-VV57_0368 [Faustovirus]|nr:hypothetical protein F-VV57_0368 [Faustovirus]QJX73636.1 hypothetical protein F-VV63_0370 [Faustovirus]
MSDLRDRMQEREIEAKINRIIVRKATVVCDYMRDISITVSAISHGLYMVIRTLYRNTNLINFMYRRIDMLSEFNDNICGISCVIIGAQFAMRHATRLIKVRPVDIALESNDNNDAYERIE